MHTSAATLAGLRHLVAAGVIASDATVAGILTGHILKDPDATVKYHTGIDVKSIQDKAPRSEPTGRLACRPIAVPDDLAAIIAAIDA